MQFESRPLEVASAAAVPTHVATQEVEPRRGQAEIHCPRCKTANDPVRERCKKCGARLLPGDNLLTRLGILTTSLLAGGAMAGLTYTSLKYPDQIPSVCPGPPYFLGAAIFFPVVGLIWSLRRTPQYTRYANRATRHLPLNPWQALDDYSQALDLAPENERPTLLKQRGALFEKLGMHRDAERDALTVITEPGAFKGEALFFKMLGADSDVYSKSRASSLRTNLVKSGKATAVGYCSQCKDVVVLDLSEHCTRHSKRKGRYIRLTLPDEIERGMQAVRREMDEESRGNRKKNSVRLMAFVVVILTIVYFGLKYF